MSKQDEDAKRNGGVQMMEHGRDIGHEDSPVQRAPRPLVGKSQAWFWTPMSQTTL
jgi:redox-sensitive bicupin YhaK (pirin superfamily)